MTATWPPIERDPQAEVDLATLRANLAFNVKSYLADATGATNSTTAFANAIAAAVAARPAITHYADVYVPAGVYDIRGLTISDNYVRLWGPGTLRKGANGAVITVNADKVEIEGLKIDGNSGSFTGNGITCQGCFHLKIRRGRIDNIAKPYYCIQFTTTQQTGRAIESCFLQLAGTPQDQGAIGFTGTNAAGAETNGDTVIRDCFCAGGVLADLHGCATVLIEGCNTTNVFFDANSKKVALVGNRIASLGADTTVLGTQHTIVGNIHAGRIILGSGTTGTVARGNVIAITADPIDSSGVAGSNRVNDYQIALARVSHGTDQAITTGVTTALSFNQDLTYPQIDQNVLPWHSTVTATSRLVAGRSGYYEYHAVVLWASNTTGRRQLVLYKNGIGVGNIQIGSTEIAPSATSTTRQQVDSGPIYMTAATITGNTTSGSPTVVNATGSPTLGQAISGTGIPAGAYITAIAGTTLTLSANATATGTGVSLAINDYVEVGVQQDTGGNLNVSAISTGTPSLRLSPVFTGKFLGAA